MRRNSDDRGRRADRRPSRLLVVAVVVGLLTAGASASAEALPSSPDDVAIVLQRINDARAAAGVAPLAVDTRVAAVAQRWAESLQSDPAQTMVHNPRFGEELAPATRSGEVISEYYGSSSVVNAWLNSSTHRGILLSNSWNAIGVAFIPDPDTGLSWAVVDFAYYPPVRSTPPAPASVDISLSDRDASVSWTAVTGSADPSMTRYDTYDVDLYDASSDSPTTGSFPRFPLTSTSYQSLQRGHSYFVRVRAYVDGLWGPFAQSPTFTVPALIPDPVTTLSILRADSTSVNTWWWASPDDNGSAVQSYTVALYRDGSLYRTSATTTNALLFSGLPQGSAYSFTVAASNSVGTSAASPMSATAELPVFPTPVTPPSDSIAHPVPPLPSTDAPTRSSSPAPSDGVTPAPVTSAPVLVDAPIVTPGPAASVTPPRSTPPSEGPRPADPRTRAAPRAPAVTSVHTAPHSATVRWRPAPSSGAPVDHYVVTVQSASGKIVRTYRLQRTRTGITLGGLRAHTRFMIAVTAYGDHGRATTSRSIRTR